MEKAYAWYAVVICVVQQSRNQKQTHERKKPKQYENGIYPVTSSAATNPLRQQGKSTD